MASASELLPIRESIRLDRVRRAMAKAMATTAGTLALSQVSRSIALDALTAAREAAAPERRWSVNTFLMAAVARVLPSHPLLNGRLVDHEVLVPAVVNLGMAVATDAGLLVPVVHRADSLSLPELDRAARDLAERARSGALRMVDIDAGTFTVSNLGTLGVDSGFALPPPPQAAILAVGRARPRWEPGPDGFVARVEASFGLTFDHRFIDGAAAAAFLDDLARRLDTIGEEA